MDAGNRGALTGTDGETVPLKELYEAMKRTTGRKILILDSCYAGSILAYAAADAGEEGICILCAAGPNSKTTEAFRDGEDYGSFTRTLIRGSDPETLPADRNGDGMISLAEAYYYTREHTWEIGNVPVVYPENGQAILWGTGQAVSKQRIVERRYRGLIMTEVPGTNGWREDR